MSFQAETIVSPTPKKGGRGRGSRNHGPKTTHEGLDDLVITPNQKKSHTQRAPSNKIMMSPPPVLDQNFVPAIEVLDITSPTPSGQKKNRTRKRTGEKHDNHTTVQSPPPVQSGTPAKPIQLYAGPTFHASPAPSSLPIPKFFTQSMQAKERASEPLHTPSSEDSSEESSSQNGGDSPTMRPSLRVLGGSNTPGRESNSLDFLFDAHRAQLVREARVQSSSSQDRTHSASPSCNYQGGPQSQFPPPPRAQPFQQSASPLQAARSPQPPASSAPAAQTNQQPYNGGNTDWAKTVALRKLLNLAPQDLTPPPPPPKSASSSPSFIVQNRPFYPGRALSENSTPTRSLHESPSIDSSHLSTPPSSGRPYQHLGKRPLTPYQQAQILNSLSLNQSSDVPSRTRQFAF